MNSENSGKVFGFPHGEQLTEGNDTGLGDLVSQAAMCKEAVDALERQLKVSKEALSTVSDKILKTLELMELENVRGHGLLFYKETKSSVSTPKTPEDKELLFDFLREQEIFTEMVSVNSATLNKLYKDFSEKAANEGILDYKLPGVGEPVIYTTLKIRKG